MYNQSDSSAGNSSAYSHLGKKTSARGLTVSQKESANTDETITLSFEDLKPILERHKGNQFFAKALKKIDNPDSLLRILSQFVQFNSVFGAGVASLASELAHGVGIFRDENDCIDSVADRSNEVAATVYFAAVDEFNRQKSHRLLAQHTLRATAQYVGHSSQTTNDITRIAEATTRATEKVAQGYCRTRDLRPQDLFRGIGFHTGSELLAVTEFEILHSYLQSHQKELVKYLVDENAYTWIAMHPVLEQDHFEAAIETGRRAISYFPQKEQGKKWVLEGFQQFSTVQEEFMSSLLALMDEQES
jgi:hypothetical protein